MPGSADTVTFDASSGGGTVTVNTTVTVQAITMGAFTGTVDFSVNNNNVTCSGNTGFSISGTGVRSLKMGSGTFSLTATSQASALWNAATTTNLTFDAGTSTIALSGTVSGSRTFAGGGLTYNNVTFGANSSKGALTVSGANTFANLTLTGPNFVALTSGSTQTVTGNLIISGASGSLVGISSNAPGLTATISKASGSVAATYIGISDVTFSGGATFTATSSYDLGRNTGITITEPTGGGSGARMIGG